MISSITKASKLPLTGRKHDINDDNDDIDTHDADELNDFDDAAANPPLACKSATASKMPCMTDIPDPRRIDFLIPQRIKRLSTSTAKQLPTIIQPSFLSSVS
jgi:hypothetical protein